MATYRSPIPRRGNSFFRDYDGLLTDEKFEDEVITFSWDLTDALESGESVSSVSSDAQSGLTISNESLSGSTYSCDVTNTGVLELEATIDSGRKLIERFAWWPKDEGESDYS